MRVQTIDKRMPKNGQSNARLEMKTNNKTGSKQLLLSYVHLYTYIHYICICIY